MPFVKKCQNTWFAYSKTATDNLSFSDRYEEPRYYLIKLPSISVRQFPLKQNAISRKDQLLQRDQTSYHSNWHQQTFLNLNNLLLTSALTTTNQINQSNFDSKKDQCHPNSKTSPPLLETRSQSWLGLRCQTEHSWESAKRSLYKQLNKATLWETHHKST